MSKRILAGDAQDKIQEILVKIGTMLAADISPDTIRFFAITETADLNINALEKTIMLGTIEEAISKLTHT